MISYVERYVTRPLVVVVGVVFVVVNVQYVVIVSGELKRHAWAARWSFYPHGGRADKFMTPTSPPPQTGC